jgi:hypothetical protein
MAQPNQFPEPKDKPPGGHSCAGWIVVGALIALALVASLIVVASDARDRFSTQTTTQTLSDNVSVSLSHAQPLPIFTEAGERLPLLIWTTGDVPTSTVGGDSALYVTVKEPWLTVLRSDGQPLGAAPLAIAWRPDHLSGAFYLAPTDVVIPSQSTAHLSVTVVSLPAPMSETTIAGGQLAVSDRMSHSTEFDVALNDSPILHVLATLVNFLAGRLGKELGFDEALILPFHLLTLRFVTQEFIKLTDAFALLVAVVFGVYQLRKWREEDRRHAEEKQRAEDRQRKEDMEDRQREEERQREEDRWRKEDRRRELERVLMMRHRRTDATESLLGQSWMDGIVDLASVTDQSQRENWESELCERLQNLAQRHCDPSRQGEFLRTVGARYKQEQDIIGLRRRLHGARCFSHDFFVEIEPCLGVIDNPTAEIDSLVQVFALWDHHSYDAWDVIAAVFCHAHKSNPERAKKIITEQLRYDADKPQDDS